VEEWISEDEYDVPAGFEEESQPGLAEEFAAESLWKYQTALDERVCGRCAPLEGVMFTLDEINEQFPNNQNFGDIIFVNMDDHGGKCRCTLIQEVRPEEVPGGEGEGEDMVEGRGTPLPGGIVGRSTSAPSLFSLLLRRPTPYRLARFGIRQILNILGLSSLAIPILAVAMPLINSYIQAEVKRQVQFQISVALIKERQKHLEELRQIYRGIVPE
jgi:hypothetical protein